MTIKEIQDCMLNNGVAMYAYSMLDRICKESNVRTIDELTEEHLKIYINNVKAERLKIKFSSLKSEMKRDYRTAIYVSGASLGVSISLLIIVISKIL